MFSFVFLLLVDTNQQLIIKLGDDNFDIREKAQKELSEKMDFDLMIELRKVDEQVKDFEIKYRIAGLINNYCKKLRPPYKIDLHGYRTYPQIDAGTPEDYILDGPWKEWDKWALVTHYRSMAEGNPTPLDDHPLWMKYRRATEFWINERLEYSFSESLKQAGSEKEFRALMDEKMKKIQQDVDMLIEGDKIYYFSRGLKNPFLKEVGR